jgi:allophanate hydrolase
VEQQAATSTKAVGHGSSTAAVERSLAAIAADGRDGIWISLVAPEVARAQAAEVDRRVAAGEDLPLVGLTLAVKDNIDVVGLPTTAGCPSFAYDPARSAPVVAALVEAGAIVVGKTNLDQFATGLVGTRSPYGACPNARWPDVISGGSSSGSAVAVAAGHVDLALGTDTAGSGRVPAAANGIVGLKPTRGRLSTAGVVPACRSIDCVSVFARSVAEAELALEVAAAAPDRGEDPYRRTQALAPVRAPSSARLGVPRSGALSFDGDATGAERFEAAVAQLAATASAVVAVDLEPFLDVARLLYQGAFVAERYEAVGAFLEGERRGVDPVVRDIILRSAPLRAFELFRDQAELARARRALEPLWERFDVLVVPTVPRLPSPAEVAAAPIEVNTMLGTYMNFVNLLDLAALTLPVPTEHDTSDRPPTSVTLIGPAWSDALLAQVARSLPSAPPVRA